MPKKPKRHYVVCQPNDGPVIYCQKWVRAVRVARPGARITSETDGVIDFAWDVLADGQVHRVR